MVAIVRKVRGGPFLPDLGPGEARHIMDKNGRWWRQSGDGAFEKAFRRPTGPPSIAKSILVGTLRLYVQLVLLLGFLAAILVGLSMLSAAATGVGIPGWLPWAGGAIAYVFILRFGRRRRWR